jgi:hypothetical protein
MNRYFAPVSYSHNIIYFRYSICQPRIAVKGTTDIDKSHLSTQNGVKRCAHMNSWEYFTLNPAARVNSDRRGSLRNMRSWVHTATNGVVRRIGTGGLYERSTVCWRRIRVCRNVTRIKAFQRLSAIAHRTDQSGWLSHARFTIARV